MAAFLGNLRSVVIAGFILALIVFIIYVETQGFDAASFWPFLIRWLMSFRPSMRNRRDSVARGRRLAR